jgi:hypothetical protein
MQKKITAWVDAIGVTGGILAPHKCWWYLVTFEYKQRQWKACLPREDFRLWIKSPHSRKVEVTKLDPGHSMNMLGVYLSPDGNTKQHVRYLREKAQRWAMDISSSSANREEVWTVLHRTIPFAMAYSLSATTLTKEDCKYIMAPIHKVGLPKAGITATIPAAIRAGPFNRGGLGILDAYTHMGASKVDTLVSNIWKGTPTGRLLELALEDLALEIGLQDPWQLHTLKQGLKYATTPSWIRHLFEFTTTNNIYIHLNIPLFQTPRTNDKTIMEAALQYTLQPQLLKSINIVRMALQVVWLSDISSATGTHLDSRCFTLHQKFPRRNNYRWPTQHYVTAKDWRIWRQWLHSLTVGNYHRLSEPLGVWKVYDPDWIGLWDCFVNESEEELYIRNEEENTWRRHILIPTQRNRHYKRYFPEYLVLGNMNGTLNQLKRASFVVRRGYIEVTATDDQLRVRGRVVPDDSPWCNITASRESILQKITDILTPVYLEATDNVDRLFHDFSTGQAVAVSDGSYFTESNGAAAAWIIESNCRTQWIRGSMQTPGPPTDLSAYRSELTGLMAISVTVKILSAGLRSPNHMIIRCDGEAALRTLKLSKDDLNTTSPHSDLCSIIVDIWSSVQTEPFPVHIQGHQDEITGRSLSRLEVLNIMMDKLATLTASSLPNTGAHLTIKSIGLPTVIYNEKVISGEVHKTLYSEMCTMKLYTYVQQQLLKGRINMDQIEMAAFTKARSMAPVYLNLFITKWISNTLATGMVMQKRKQRIFNRCPRCNQWGEDRLHVIICWDARAKLIWNHQMDTFKRFLSDEGTCPDIANYIVTGLHEFRSKPNHHQAAPLPWQRELLQIG